MHFRKCATSAASVSLFVAATLSTLLLPRTAMALPSAGAFTITITPDGAGNVVASGSGDVNINAGTNAGNNNEVAWMSSAFPFIFTGQPATNLATYSFSNTNTGPTDFGTGSPITATSNTGGMFGFTYSTFSPGSPIDLFVPNGYTTDTAFTNTSTYTGATLSTLGLSPGTYTWTTGFLNNANTITIIVNDFISPEPASLSLLGLGSLALLRRRKAR
jgi:hypothetical protein